MCARYTLTLEQARLVIAGLVHIFAFAPRYNIGPAQRVPVILNTAEGVKAMEIRWGIPHTPGAFEFAIALRHILHLHFVRIRRLTLSRIRAVGVSATCPCRIVSES